MEAKATLKHARVAPRKARLVVDLIRDKQAGEALNMLRFVKRHAAKVVEKVLKSALANAQVKEIGDPDTLWVSTAYVNGGPTLKRVQPGPMGRANPIKKRTSHITLGLSPKGGAKEKKGSR
jgi:large subunit ribosomal protein L22